MAIRYGDLLHYLTCACQRGGALFSGRGESDDSLKEGHLHAIMCQRPWGSHREVALLHCLVLRKRKVK